MLMRKLFLLVLLLLVLVVAPACAFTVDHGEYVYVTQLGRHVATYDGADTQQAGLHFKWPWPIQSVQRLDRRLQYLDLPGAELLTRDRESGTIDQTLTIDAYVCWRIADRESVDRFIRTVGTIKGAAGLLDKDINNELGAAIGRMALADLISTDPGKVAQERERLRERLMEYRSAAFAGQNLRERAREKYGIEVVDVRLRRSNHPPAVRPAIFDRIRSERDRKAAQYESRGDRLAAEVRTDGELERDRMKTDAEKRAIQERARGEKKADEILNEAQLAQPAFYALLKELDDLKRIVGSGKTLLLLSTKRFKTLNEPPALTPAPMTPTPERKGDM
jgi:membrane protease subunit HflC